MTGGHFHPHSRITGAYSLVLLLLLLGAPATRADDKTKLARAEALVDAKDFDGALKLYDGMLGKNPADLAARVARGQALVTKGDDEAALTEFNRVLGVDAKSTAALLERQAVYERKGQHDLALADLNELVRLQPKETYNYICRARIYRTKKQFPEAFADAQQVIALAPDWSEGYLLRGLVFVSQGNQPEALEDFNEAYQRAKEDVEILNARSNALMKLGRAEEALADMRESFRLKPKDKYRMNGLAWALATCPDEKFVNGPEAVTLAKQACEAEGWKSGWVIDTLAVAYAASGDFSNAITWEKKAIELEQRKSSREGMQKQLDGFEKGQPYRQPAPDAEKLAWAVLRSSCLKVVWQTVADNYFDPTFGGVDWVAMREKYRQRLVEVSDNTQLRVFLQKLLGEIHRSHFHIIPRSLVVFTPAERTRIGSTGGHVALIENVPVIFKVDTGSPAEQAGLKPGDEIKAVDQTVLNDVAKTIAPTAMSPRKMARHMCDFVNAKFTPIVGTKVTFTVAGLDGVERKVEVTGEPTTGVWSEPMGHFPSLPVEWASWRRADGVAYVRFNLFVLPAIRSYKKFMRTLQPGDGLIIDLRGNPGGITQIAAGMCGWLSDREFSLGLEHCRESQEELMSYPQSGAFAGPVAVLVDAGSASTSEIMAAGLKEIGRARVFGETTAGAALPSEFARLPNDDKLQFATSDILTPKGTLIEGNGVVPDEVVLNTRADCAAGRDPVLLAAEQWIAAQQQAAKEASRK